MRKFIYVAMAAAVIGCGGGSESSDPVDQLGGLTVLIGDGPLDDVEEVNIDIGRMVLIGESGQIVLTEDATTGPIDLLELRNITELLLDVDDIPAGNYSKIRMYIDSLDVLRMGGGVAEIAQLPANGKIDLNPQGAFEISPGEDLVVQIDIDLARSVHVVQTGNSRYRFRPVVFIDVLDQRANLRLTKLFGIAQNVSPDTSFNLCDPEVLSNCISVDSSSPSLELPVMGETADMAEVMESNEVHVFGHFVVAASEEDGIIFRALATVLGAEDTVAMIDGEVMVVSPDDDSIASIGGAAVMSVDGALLLDGLGNRIEGAMDGQEADSWAQVDPTLDLPDPFPSFLTQVGSPIDEDSVAGTLIGIDGNSLTIRTDDLEEVCVTVNGQTLIQEIEDYASDASAELVSLTVLGALMSEPEIEAFGVFDENVPPCLVASVIVVEI